MRIRVKATGRIFPTAQWFGFNWWIRAWDGRDGWYHYPASEVEILEEKGGEGRC